MTRAELISAVKVRLEELTPFNEGLVVLANETNVKPITSYVEALLDEASDEVRVFVPLHLITPATLSGDVTIPNNDGVGIIPLPEDYLRLYAFRMASWSREITRPISTENPEYILQRNPHTRGKSVKPVIAINNSGTSRVLELYSIVGEPTVAKKLYVKKIAAEDNPAVLIPFVILMCAIKVYNVIERPDIAKVLSGEFSDLIKLNQL